MRKVGRKEEPDIPLTPPNKLESCVLLSPLKKVNPGRLEFLPREATSPWMTAKSI
jgi:hypothetical protein